MRQFLFPVLFLLFATYLQGQEYEKWGDISSADLALTQCAFEPQAKAMILQDRGEITFSILGGQPTLRFTQHQRLKIFDITALEKEKLLIPYYGDGNWEKLLDLDVQVFAPDGKKTKVNASKFTTTKLDENWNAKEIALEKLQNGSIVEYRYEIETTDYGILRPWVFQRSFPNRLSQYFVVLPEMLEYAVISQNSGIPVETKKIPVAGSMVPGVDLLGTLYQVRNSPSIAPEPFISSLNDHHAQIAFQLQSLINSYGGRENIMTTWPNLGKLLIEADWFGGQYLGRRTMDKLNGAFQAAYGSNGSKEEIIAHILEFVSNEIKWNGQFSISSKNGIQKSFSINEGNSSDINLAVIALCKANKIPAEPMLVSTRNHGKYWEIYPFYQQFNSVIAYLPDSTGFKLLDATSPFHAVNFASQLHCNKQGWVVRAENPEWVQFTPPESVENNLATLTLDAQGTLSGTVTMSFSGHRGVAMKEALNKAPSGAFLVEQFTDKYPEAVIDSLTFKNENRRGEPLQVSFFVKIPHAAAVVGDILYLKPVISYKFRENPFKPESRKLPVSFPYPMKIQYIANIKLPAGYAVDKLPAAQNIQLDQNGGKMTLSCTAAETLQFNLRSSIKQLDFDLEAYPDLRAFFEKIEAAASTTIVLKKQP